MPKAKPRTKPTKSHARALAKHTPDHEVTVKVDAKLKKRWSALIAIVHTAKSSEAKDFDRLWEAVSEIVDHDLYLLGGYADAADFFARELGENERNAYRYMKVAKFASPAEEERYGITKIDAALTLITAKIGAPIEHPPLPIAFEKLRIPTGAGKTASLETARVEDITAATRALTKKGGEPANDAERALKAVLAKHPALKSVRVRVRNGLANLIGVPVGSLGVFATVVKTAKWAPGKTPSKARK